MSESTEISFDTLLQMDEVKITDVVEKDYIIYFKANGHQFCSANGRVYHEKSVMYDMPPIKIWAKQERDPKAIVAKEKRDKEFDANWSGWQKFEDKIIEIAFAKMMPHILLNDMANARKVFEYYFDCILPGNGANKLVKKFLKDEDGDSK